MALTKDEIKAAYPLPVYNYKVNIGGDTISFSEVSGLGMSFETITYKESKTLEPGAGPNVMIMPGQANPVSITLKKGYVRGKSLPVFYDWINSVQLNLVDKKNITVQLCDETGTAVVSWNVLNAFPTKLDAPGFTADSNEVAIESMELTADRVTMEES